MRWCTRFTNTVIYFFFHHHVLFLSVMQTFSWHHLFASFLIFYPQHSADVILNVKQDKRSKSRSLVFWWLLCHYHCFLFIGTWKPFTFCKIKSQLHLNIVKMVCFFPNLVPHFFLTYVYSNFKSILNVLTDCSRSQRKNWTENPF